MLDFIGLLTFIFTPPQSEENVADKPGAQEVRSVLGKQIQEEVFFAKMNRMAQTDENSSRIQEALKWMVSRLEEAA